MSDIKVDCTGARATIFGDDVVEYLSLACVFDVVVSNDAKTATFTDGCDECYSADLNRAAVTRLIEQLGHIRSSMVDS